ncbi:hypothetical protein DB29_02165 [Shouchella clausii]|nr:hypothetical protein DB29_02165 [Shouchella clausii]
MQLAFFVFIFYYPWQCPLFQLKANGDFRRNEFGDVFTRSAKLF